MFQKNNPEKGGSFYLQSKIFFAKEHLMQDFPADLNKSQFNPNPEEAAQTAAEDKKAAEEEQKKKEWLKRERDWLADRRFKVLAKLYR